MRPIVQQKIPVAIVTGASGDIGRAVVDRLLRENWAVMMFSRNTRGGLADTHNSMRDKYPMAILRSCTGSVTDHGAVDDMLMLVNKVMGPIDLLVTAHGAKPSIHKSETMPMWDFLRIIESDVVGTFNVCQRVGRVMLRQGYGSIVNISSVHSIATYPCRSAYAAAKSAVVGLSRVLAIEWAQGGVRVNVVSPWQVSGSRTRSINGKQTREMLQSNPSGRLIEPEEVAAAVMFLHNTPAMNGHNLVLDGGLTASAWYMPYPVSEGVHA
ncbi:MAG TPA: SDR family oxidoreductase [Alphaproteobacteria bacterium]|nr:SDR family oxidoreductase [Alphaproteobacteria bacterium]